MQCLKFIVWTVLMFVSNTGCRGAFTPSFELDTEEDSEKVFESEPISDTTSDTETENNEIETTDLFPFNTDSGNENTDSDSDSETEPDIFFSSDSVSDADSGEELSTQTEDETESILDSGEDSENVTSSDSISDAGLDTDIDSDENNTTDDNFGCPGSCQHNRYTREELEVSGLIAGFSIDPSVNSILICDNGTAEKGFQTFPIYSGWIRDNSYQCDDIREYCCRPQTVFDVYCSDTGGTCVPSSSAGDGAGFCAFASNECKQGD